MIVLLHGAPAFGAVEHYVREIALGLGERGEKTLLLYPDVAATLPFAELHGGSVCAETFPSALLATSTAMLRHLVSRLRRERPHVVHVTDVWPPALVAARLARVPRVLVTHHTPELPRADNLVGRVWQRLGWTMRPEVVYTSETDRRNDARRLRSHVVHLGIDLERFAREPVTHAGPVVGNVARLAEQKGHRHLIEAAPAVLERHPGARFLLVGGGELRADLERRIDAAGLADRFELTGEVTDVPAQLARMDVFALPSHYEGLCYAVIEAQAAGVPVVATRVGGVPENVVPGETGVLVPVRDSDALAAGIVELLDDPVEARRLAENARRRVHERYALPRMVAETVALYGLRA